MKQRLLLLLVAFVSLATYAQTEAEPQQQPVLKFGYLSYDAALRSLPDYQVVQQNMADLRAKYEAEVKRVENDFNKRYEEFLEGMKDFPQTILQKRQRELQELLEKNIEFKRQSRNELKQAEADAMAPLRQKLADALAAIGQECGYAFIVNTDGDACPFINPLMGEDVSEALAVKLAE